MITSSSPKISLKKKKSVFRVKLIGTCCTTSQIVSNHNIVYYMIVLYSCMLLPSERLEHFKKHEIHTFCKLL